VSTNHLVKPVKILVDEPLNHAENIVWFVVGFFLIRQQSMHLASENKKKKGGLK